MALPGLVHPAAKGHTAHLHTLEGRRAAADGRRHREVHIQTGTTRQTVGQHTARDIENVGAQRLEVGIGTMVAQRERHRGYVLHAALHDHAHRTTVMGIHRGIVTMIDTTDDKVWLAVQNIVERHLHAVHWCTVARPHLHMFLLTAQRQPQRQFGRESTGEARTCPIRGAHHNIAQRRHHVYQFVNALSLITVVVGYQNKGSFMGCFSHILIISVPER